MPRNRGFTLPEISIALFILAVGVLVMMQTVGTAGKAARASDSKARAVRDTDVLMRRLAYEVSQSTTRVDPGLPPGEDQRLWILQGGVRFQRVVGYELDEQGEALQKWSTPIMYLWDQGTGVVTRVTDGGPARVAARNVAKFATAVNGSGQVVVSRESKVGAANRGTQSGHARTIRVTPRNDLR